MTHGFKLCCEGIVGDGCGGGREFCIEGGTLSAKDPLTKEQITLLEGIIGATAIRKSGCKLFIETETKPLVFNLSKLALEA